MGTVDAKGLSPSLHLEMERNDASGLGASPEGSSTKWQAFMEPFH